jgi:hypothetical protein
MAPAAMNLVVKVAQRAGAHAPKGVKPQADAVAVASAGGAEAAVAAQRKLSVLTVKGALWTWANNPKAQPCTPSTRMLRALNKGKDKSAHHATQSVADGVVVAVANALRMSSHQPHLIVMSRAMMPDKTVAPRAAMSVALSATVARMKVAVTNPTWGTTSKALIG